MRNQIEIENLEFSGLVEKVAVLYRNAIGTVACARQSTAFAVLATLLAGCGSQPSAVTQPNTRPNTQPDIQSSTRQDGGMISFSCAVDETILNNEGAVDMVSSEIEVHDGDTVKDMRETYRLSAIDAAECAVCFGDGTGWPNQYGVGSHSQVDYCMEGTVFVGQTIHAAERVQKVTGRIDDHGRRLAYFVADGQLLNCLLVRGGLAYETVSYYGLGSHPPFAQMVVDAAEFAGQPSFQEPYKYKQESRRPRDECR